jgi:hypothetical protein
LNRLAFQAQHCGGRDLRPTHGGWCCTKFPCLQTPVELLPDLAVGRFTHPALEGAFEDGATVFDGGTLEEMISGISHRPLRRFIWLLHLLLSAFSGLRNNMIGLMTILRGQIAMLL